MADNHWETLYGQMFRGIAQLINGEGGSGRLIGLALSDDGRSVVAELVDVPDSFLPELLDEVKEEVMMWRVNPFTDIRFDDHRHLRFSLKQDDEIERLFRQSQL